ncbi:hypothetical protein I204_04271 [Kwoniella mangroviensis CBS 8886]|uniref:uncharacterized protein n=1 Tax=Kwoniella mangroviensis CBS 8507 TaxID=1296122 RepID=UPI00080D335D|nr:uncharacterized protein I203_07348 [Kwoniella mangroviensis CBS 8507]OCF63650.1 hypothetical protein I203_07348 [Kwoniella mangroviensis CBS 8507]OCF75416.1 hypothetical protein I204_04271 [Kwoniella mangroviensis CBS 8886]
MSSSSNNADSSSLAGMVRNSYLRNISMFFPDSSTAKEYGARSPFKFASRPIAQLEGDSWTKDWYGGVSNWTGVRNSICLIPASKERQNDNRSSNPIDKVELISEWKTIKPCALGIVDEADQRKLGKGDASITLKSKLVVDASQFVQHSGSLRENPSLYQPVGSDGPIRNDKFDDFANLKRSIPDFIRIMNHLNFHRKEWLGEKIDLSGVENFTMTTASFNLSKERDCPGDNLTEVTFSWSESDSDRRIPVSGKEVLTAEFQITNCQWW